MICQSRTLQYILYYASHVNTFNSVGGGDGRKKESAATEYYVNEDLGGGSDVSGVVVADLARGSAYEELQQSALPYEHVYSICKRDGVLDGVGHPAGGASRPDNQPTERVPGRHYTALNMESVATEYYEDMGQGGGGECKKRESAATEYYEDM